LYATQIFPSLLSQETVIRVGVTMILTVASVAFQRFVQFFPAFPGSSSGVPVPVRNPVEVVAFRIIVLYGILRAH